MHLVREYINEKFTDESDPIKDLGIGIYHERNFESDEDIIEWLCIVSMSLFKLNNIKDLLTNDGVYYIKPVYADKLREYSRQYVSLNERKINEPYFPRLAAYIKSKP